MAEEALTGEASTTSAGTATPSSIVRLRSLKLEQPTSATQPLSGVSMTSSQGSFGKARTRAMSGSAIAALQGSVSPPATSVPKVVLIGSGRTSKQFRLGPADRVNRTVMDQHIAATPQWTVFADALQRISPSRNGVRIPTQEFVKMHVWGSMNQLYEQVPATPIPVYWENTEAFSAIEQQMATANHAKPGVRGVAIMNPFTTWRGHTRIREDGTFSLSPNIPQWVGVQWDGVVSFAMRNGRIFDAHKLPGVRGATDLALTPSAPSIFYVSDAITGKVLRIDRHSEPGPEVFAQWTTTTFATFTSPTSLRFGSPGPLYVCDNAEGRLYSLDQFGNKTIVMSIPSAFWVDGMNDGRLVITTTTGLVHIVDPSIPTIQQTINTGVPAAWMPVSVDRNGTFGPANEFTVIAVSGGGTNIRLWRFQNGSLVGPPWPDQGIMSSGLTRSTDEPHGHYPWMAEHHPDEAIMLVQGLANVYPSLIVAKPPNYPAEDTYNNTLAQRGSDIISYGTVSGVAYDDTKPTFTCLISEGGWSLVGCTADFIAEKSFADAAAFIQQGMIGSFPRPEIRGLDLYAVMYYIYRNSQRFLREGATLMSGLQQFCAPLLGQELPPISQRIPDPDADTQMDVEVDGDQLVVRFKEKHNSIKTPPDSTIVVRILVDEGLPEQIDLGTVGTPWRLPKPSLTAGEHSLRARPVSGSADLGQYRGRATILVQT